MFSLRNLLKYQITRVVSQESRRFVKDAGIGRRQKALNLDPNELEDVDIDDFESDFMNVHKSHKQHLDEIATRKEQEKYLIVNRKYFKQQLPNFLTWHDKEQIRYLHRTNPEEWTIEQLSESFPALPAVISKIVKSDWAKVKPDKITNHDRSVQRNWQMFKQGQLQQLPNDLVEHLQKFSDRSLNFQPFEIPTKSKKIELNHTNIKTEFSEIITSYQKLKNKTQNDHDCKKLDEEIKPPPKGDTYLISEIRKTPPITLNELQNRLKSKISNGENIEIDDKLIVENIKSGKINENNYDTVDLTVPKYEKNSIKTTNKNSKHLQYPDRIQIPKKLVKKNNIYKLNDCYYDYDGEFLYRVPGMG